MVSSLKKAFDVFIVSNSLFAEFCDKHGKPVDENLLLLCQTKPFTLLTDDEHDVWHWYCSTALPIANDKYKELEVQSQQLMSSVISLSDETFIFSEIKQRGHLWAQIRLVNGKEACLEYNKRNIEKLKRKTPNHHLIEKII